MNCRGSTSFSTVKLKRLTSQFHSKYLSIEDVNLSKERKWEQSCWEAAQKTEAINQRRWGAAAVLRQESRTTVRISATDKSAFWAIKIGGCIGGSYFIPDCTARKDSHKVTYLLELTRSYFTPQELLSWWENDRQLTRFATSFVKLCRCSCCSSLLKIFPSKTSAK